MTDDQTNSDDKSMNLAKLRAMAQYAMEGEERRKKRDFEQRLRKEKEEQARGQKEEAARQEMEKFKMEEDQLARLKAIREERRGYFEQEKTELARIREEKEVFMSPIRTLESDAAGAIKSTNASRVSMVIQEDEKRRRTEAEKVAEEKKSGAVLWLSIAFLVIAIGVVGFIYYRQLQENRIKTVPNAAIKVDSIIFAESYQDVVINEENAVSLKEKLRQLVVNLGASIGTIQYVRLVDNAAGTLRTITGPELLAQLGTRTPDTVIRNLRNDLMVGLFSNIINGGFIILRTNYYEQTVAGMFEWEPYLARDLYAILNGKSAGRQILDARFEDEVVKNMDTRVVKGEDGLTTILYGFMTDRQMLIIANNEATFVEVVARLNTPKPK